MQLVHGPEFKIYLDTNHVILNGSADESAGVLLRGSVVLNCHETTKIRTITLRFEGRTKVRWVEGQGTSNQRQYKEEHIILERDWSFLSPDRKMHHFAKGKYKWDFELPLPGTIPATVNHELGQVAYRLKAVAERPTFMINYADRQPIHVTRVLSPSSASFVDLEQPLIISNVWANKLSYDISIPSKVFNAGTTIPISFDLRPSAPGLVHIRSVMCTLKEYTTFSTATHKRTKSRTVQYLRDDHYRASKTELLQIPHLDSREVLLDTAGQLIKVRHKLKFSVSLSNPDGHVSELKAAVPIVIAALAPEDDWNTLPAYQEAWQSISYDAQLARLLARPQAAAPPSAAHANDCLSPASCFPSPSSSPPDDQGANAPLFWQGMDLQRVPSYTTAVNRDRFYRQSASLPLYDTIVMPAQVAT